MNTLGLTVSPYHVGLSLVTAVPGAGLNQHVLYRDIVNFTGGTLLIGGQTLLNGIGYVQIANTALPYRIEGPANFFIGSGGGTVTAHIITQLSQWPGTTLNP